MINKDLFFEKYPYQLTSSKKEAIIYLLDKFDESDKFTRISEMAYFLATAKLETADSFLPVVEGYYMSGNRKQKLYNYYQKNNPHALKTIFPNGLSDPTYEGRGYVQITHNFNYQKHQDYILEKFGVDIVSNPDEILNNKDIAFEICQTGMFVRELSFTGKVMGDYFNDDGHDFLHARKIINGMNAASEIAGYAEKFFNIIEFV